MPDYPNILEGATSQPPRSERTPHDLTEKILLRIKPAAYKLSISEAQCYKLIRNHVIPSIKLGGSLRVPLRALEQLIDEWTDEANEALR